MTLTPRQTEIITLIADGNKRNSIAKLLGISFDTVNFHLDTARIRLEAKNTVNAVAICLREKIIT